MLGSLPYFCPVGSALPELALQLVLRAAVRARPSALLRRRCCHSSFKTGRRLGSLRLPELLLQLPAPRKLLRIDHQQGRGWGFTCTPFHASPVTSAALASDQRTQECNGEMRSVLGSLPYFCPVGSAPPELALLGCLWLL